MNLSRVIASIRRACGALFFLGVASGLVTPALLAAGPGTPLAEQIGQIVESAHRSGKFDGTVLVTRKGRTLYEGNFGFADVEAQRANTSDTRYLAFSVVKPMTAILVFQLLESGAIHLDDSLDRFFPTLTGKPAGRMTLQRLLTHTSGLLDVIGEHPDRRITAQDLETARIKPDADFEYSSAGYVCLGLVLEAATGKSYETLVYEKILLPAGMKDSGLARTGVTIPHLARGYIAKGDRRVPSELGVAVEALDGAGSLYTTTRDLERFDRALTTEKILSRKMQALMLSHQVKDRFGYGWFLSEQGGKYFPWHKGDFRGYTAVLVWQIHREEIVVLLSNLQDADVLGMRTKILQALKATPEN